MSRSSNFVFSTSFRTSRSRKAKTLSRQGPCVASPETPRGGQKLGTGTSVYGPDMRLPSTQLHPHPKCLFAHLHSTTQGWRQRSCYRSLAPLWASWLRGSGVERNRRILTLIGNPVYAVCKRKKLGNYGLVLMGGVLEAESVGLQAFGKSVVLAAFCAEHIGDSARTTTHMSDVAEPSLHGHSRFSFKPSRAFEKPELRTLPPLSAALKPPSNP